VDWLPPDWLDWPELEWLLEAPLHALSTTENKKIHILRRTLVFLRAIQSRRTDLNLFGTGSNPLREPLDSLG
jgi:hypothetical protein